MKKIIPILLLTILITTNAFGATQLLKTVKPSGGDYTSLEACMNANEKSLTASDEYFDVEIDGSWSSADTTAVTIHNYTTDATRYINIYTTSTARHNGIWSTSAYNLSGSTNYINMIYINSPVKHFRIDGIQCSTTAAYSVRLYSQAGFDMSSGSDFRITNSIFKGPGNGSDSDGFGIVIDSGNYKINNSIIYKLNGSGIRIFNGYTNPVVYIENTTVVNNTVYGINRNDSGTVYCKNTYVGGSGTADYQGTITLTTATSSDATGTAGLQSILVSTTADSTHVGFTNVTAGSEDFHIKTSSPLIDVGTDLSADAGWVLGTVDIDGTTRSGTWDIGADEYVSAGTPAGWTFSQLIMVD